VRGIAKRVALGMVLALLELSGSAPRALADRPFESYIGNAGYPGKPGKSDAAVNGWGFEGIDISPDGKNVYALNYYAQNSNRILVFARDAVTGRLTFIQEHGGAGRLWGIARGLVVSPDGKNVYACDHESNSGIVIFQRDPDTGWITMIGEGDECNGHMALSADGLSLYSNGTTYCDVVDTGCSYVTAFDVYSRDPATGLLTKLQTFRNGYDGLTMLKHPSEIAVSPDGISVYVVSTRDGLEASPSLVTFSRDLGTGMLTLLSAESAVFSPDVVYLDPVVSPDGRHVYVSDSAQGINQALWTFDRDTATGALTHNSTSFDYTLDGEPPSAPVVLGFSGDGLRAYGWGFSKLEVHSYDALTGALTPRQFSRRLVSCPGHGVVISPDERHSYGPVFFDGPDIASYRLAPAGTLCPPVPQAGCKTAAKGKLKVKKKADPERSQFRWTWAGGDETLTSELGDPTVSTDYALCVYDESAGVAALVVKADAPAGGGCCNQPCWRSVSGGTSYKLNDRGAGHGEGFTLVDLRPDVAGKAKVKVKGETDVFPMPPLPLQQDQQLIVQLLNNEGTCWESRFMQPANANQSDLFSDVAK
jgi:DNA-binding beta-propeller fold protein YncE